MAQSTITKDRFSEFVDAVRADIAVYGPTAEARNVAFRKIASADELALDCRISTISAKELFLPETETVYEFDGEDFVDHALPDEERVVVGMRPCDCRALTLLDKIFETDEVTDPFYAARRAATVVVGLACDRPSRTCFCTAVGGDPFSEDGADVLLADAGESFLARAVTQKGEDFLARYQKFFSDGGAGNWEEQAQNARGKVADVPAISGAAPRLAEMFEHDVWETVSRKCLGCGTCSYLCPVCYCFDLTDEKTTAGMKKIKRWDCCMFPEFTLHASGHNPRSANAARLRQKIMHKFSYYVERYDVNGCVGCGRCVRSCPVNLDVREALGEITAAPAVPVEK